MPESFERRGKLPLRKIICAILDILIFHLSNWQGFLKIYTSLSKLLTHFFRDQAVNFLIPSLSILIYSFVSLVLLLLT